MKRSITIAAILLSIVALSIGSLFYLHRVEEEMTGLLEGAARSAQAEDFEAARQTAAKAEERWQEYEKRLSLFVRHGELDEMTKVVAELTDYAQQKDAALFCASADKAASIIRHIYETELPTIKNFF